jgi:acyl dehydratase
MAGFARHLIEQRRGIVALSQLLLAPRSERAALQVPGPWVESRVPAPSHGLIRDFLRFTGGDSATYRDVIPPHLFPQWSLPAMLQVARSLPYDPTKVINAGCRLTVFEPLPVNRELHVASQLTRVDDNGKRARINILVRTGTAQAPHALEAELRVFIPLRPSRSSSRRSNGTKALGVRDAKPQENADKPRVPERARELSYLRLRADAGKDFAFLTGDFNPIHWLGVYARSAGFKRVILHGFGSFALVFESVVRALLAGDAPQLTELDAEFTRPLQLPAKVGVYLNEPRQLFFGDAPNGTAFLTGRFTLRDDAQGAR